MRHTSPNRVLLWTVVGIAGWCASIMVLGAYRHWDSNSFFDSPDSSRFDNKPEDPTQSPNWYYWKLPQHLQTPFNLSVPWICFILHLAFTWTVQYMAQFHLPSLQYTPYMKKWNWIALTIQVAFHLVHLMQTHWTYGALADSTPIASSQGSVIMMLVLILIMESKTRGLFMGYFVPTNLEPMQLVRKYHGYAISWAVIYTFWYHPTENTIGHIFGFIYTSLLMLQGTFFYTQLHTNFYWRMVLELFVILHGGSVSYQTSGPEMNGTRLWPMFVFGFLGTFFVNQIYSFAYWRASTIRRFIPPIVFTLIVIASYSQIPDRQGRYYVRFHEALRIPMVEVLFTWFGIYVCNKIITLLDTTKVKHGFIWNVLLFIATTAIGVAWFYHGVEKVPIFLTMLILVTFYLIITMLGIVLIGKSDNSMKKVE